MTHSETAYSAVYTKTTPGERDPSIDYFRGLAILMMFIANYMEHIRSIPAWLKHAPDIGITVIDFIAPFFIFAIGLTYNASVKRRLNRTGWQKTCEHFFARGMALIGIGMMFSVGESSYGFSNSPILWGVLQAIGASILLTFPTLFLPTTVRCVVALLILIGYQIGLDRYWLATVLTSSHAGLPGIFGWTGMLILSTVFADMHANDRNGRYWLLTLFMFLLGIGLSYVIPISKHRVSFTFVCIVVSSAAACFGLIKIFVNNYRFRSDVLRIMGINALALYCIHLILLAIFLVPPIPLWHFEAPIWQAFLQGIGFLGLLYLIAWSMDKRKIYISL
jgi:predicted acyltransferase